MESALWIFRGSSFHYLAAEVPKRRFPNHMDLFLYGRSDVNAIDQNSHQNPRTPASGIIPQCVRTISMATAEDYSS